MRNQFGGHAVQTAPPPGGDASRRRLAAEPARVRLPPDPARLPLLRRRRRRRSSRASRRSSAATGRARPTWSRRSTTSPGSPPTGSPPTPRWSGPAPTRRVVRAAGGPRRAHGGARGRAQPRPRQPGPGQPVAAAPGPRAGRPGAHRRLLARGPRPWSRATRPTGAGSSTTCWCCARRGWPASAPTTTGCSGSATRCSRPPAPRAAAARREESALSTLGVWDAHLARTGAELLAERLALVDALRPVPRQGLRDRRPRRDPRRRRDRVRAVVRRSPAPHRPRPALTEALLAELERRRGDELDRGISPGRPAPRRAACSPSATADSRLPVKGYASPRRVLVVRARAAAGVVRPAARRRRRPDPDPRRRVRRARHRAPRPARRRWSPAPSRCWSPRRSPPTCPRRWPGSGSSSRDGEVTP